MTFPAIHLFMFPFQRKEGGTVVKFVQARPTRKRLLGMALLAIGSEVVIVWVVVATIAVFEWYVGEFLK